MSTSCEIALRLMPQKTFDYTSVLVQVSVRQKACTWTNVYPDLCCHITLQGHSELTIAWAIGKSLTGLHLARNTFKTNFFSETHYEKETPNGSDESATTKELRHAKFKCYCNFLWRYPLVNCVISLLRAICMIFGYNGRWCNSRIKDLLIMDSMKTEQSGMTRTICW